MSTSHIKIKKICEFCKQEFMAQKTTTRFCSKKCAERAYKLRLRIQKVEQHEQMSQKEPMTTIAENLQYLSPNETAKLLGITARSVYNLIYTGVLKAAKLSSRMTMIRKEDIDRMLEVNPYQKRHKREATPITEFYTTAEVEEKFGVSTSWVFKVGKEENIPKTINRGKTMWSKKHFDAYFAGESPSEEITEWYTVEEMKQTFGMTNSAVYSFVSKYSIPKKKVKREVFYSKKHVDIAKGIAVAEVPQYYTVKEAMEKYQLTRDQLYHYVKWHKIPKVQEGKYVKISRKELDALLAPPII